MFSEQAPNKVRRRCEQETKESITRAISEWLGIEKMDKKKLPIGSFLKNRIIYYSIVGLNSPPQSLFCRIFGFLSIID
jgi:hypothetical protein